MKSSVITYQLMVRGLAIVWDKLDNKFNLARTSANAVSLWQSY
jgi:uncharacterized membrane protein